MATMESVLITGANAGLGREAARQLALSGVERIYLGCRNKDRANEAKRSLEEVTNEALFEILLIDVSKPDSVRSAVASLPEPIDAVIMNAGGMGGTTPGELTADGVTQQFAANVLGHVVLVDELIKAERLSKVAIYAGSEASRGEPKMRIKRPALATSSVEEFKTIADGTFWGEDFDGMAGYAMVKYVAALWMSSAARENPGIRFVTVSPGGTSGTNGMDDLPGLQRFMFKHIGTRVMPLFGMMHGVDEGADRYLQVLTDEQYTSGKFYASKPSKGTGPLVEQETIFEDLANETIQDNASEAVHSFID